MNVEIRPAQEGDLNEIVAIAESQSLGVMEVDMAEKSGFLVSGYTRETYLKYLESTEYFFVATISGRVMAFILAYDSDGIQPEETVNALLKNNLVEPFVLIKQICVATDGGGQGLASKLYRYLYSHASHPHLAAAVVTEPYNERSISFHEKQGFFKLCSMLPPADGDGKQRLRGIWFKDMHSNQIPEQRWVGMDSELEQTLAMEKQHAAIGLYTHEDNLNWTKFGMLITFMFALLAAADYLLKKPPNMENMTLSAMLVLLGFSINLMFYQKIQSGLMYMAHHKRSVNELDAHIHRLNPHLRRLVRDSNDKIRGSSVTTAWMKWVPLISMFIWSVCSILLLFNQLRF